MSKNKLNIYAAAQLSTSVAKFLNFEAMDALQKKCTQLFNDYQNKPSLVILSHIDFTKLESFNKWIPEALANKKTVIPYLVSNMLEGDIYALSMYDSLYKTAGKDEMVVDYYNIITTTELQKTFKEYGGTEDARAIITAEHWLKSAEAADIFKENNGAEELCTANAILHINNEYIHC